MYLMKLLVFCLVVFKPVICIHQQRLKEILSCSESVKKDQFLFAFLVTRYQRHENLPLPLLLLWSCGLTFSFQFLSLSGSCVIMQMCLLIPSTYNLPCFSCQIGIVTRTIFCVLCCRLWHFTCFWFLSFFFFCITLWDLENPLLKLIRQISKCLYSSRPSVGGTLLIIEPHFNTTLINYRRRRVCRKITPVLSLKDQS